MMQLLAGAGPGQGQRVPGKSWSRPRLWPSSCAMEEATPRMLVEWSCGGGELRSTLVLSPPGPPGHPAGTTSLLNCFRRRAQAWVGGNLGSVLPPSPCLPVWPWEGTSVP